MDPQQSSLENERLSHASPEQLREDIRGTRRHMDETLDELGNRLHPRHLLDDVIDLFRSGEGGSSGKVAQAGKSLGQTVAREIKERPLPALLVGAGLAWWIFDAASSDETGGPAGSGQFVARRSPASLEHYPPVTGSGYTAGGAAMYDESGTTTGYVGGSAGYSSSSDEPGLKEKAMGAASAVGEKISGAISGAGEKLSQAGSAVGSAAHSGIGSVRGAGRRVSGYASERGQALGDRASQAQDRLRDASDEYPLAMGGVLLAAGLLVGLLLPRSEREDEWMGEASDQLKESARTTGEDLLERGRAVAGQTAASALDEAESRGITPGNIAEKAGHVLSDALHAAKESAQREGIDPSRLAEDAKAIAKEATQTAKSSAGQGTGGSQGTTGGSQGGGSQQTGGSQGTGGINRPGV